MVRLVLQQVSDLATVPSQVVFGTELVLRGSTGDEAPALDAGLSGPALSHSSHA